MGQYLAYDGECFFKVYVTNYFIQLPNQLIT